MIGRCTAIGSTVHYSTNQNTETKTGKTLIACQLVKENMTGSWGLPSLYICKSIGMIHFNYKIYIYSCMLQY